MTTSKYIIKNCENYDNFLQEPTCNKYPCDCQTKTDCLLKQIVKQASYCLCPEILELLDIQEVE